MKKTMTYGLSHLAIAVKDLDRTLLFYQKVFDVKVMYHENDFLQVTTPGSHDIIVFEKKKAEYGNTGGIAHFGFRLRDPKDIDVMAQRVKQADGVIIDQGEFVPGSPYIFFKDPDGYEVEVWYEVVNGEWSMDPIHHSPFTIDDSRFTIDNSRLSYLRSPKKSTLCQMHGKITRIKTKIVF